MGWIISEALYEKWHCSQALVEAFSADTSLDGKQSAPLNGNPTQLAYLSPDKMTKFSRLSRFGMTFKPLTADRGEDLLMWFRGDFLVKTYPAQDEAQELTESDLACGSTWRGSLAKYDPKTHTLKTAQCSLFEDLNQSSATLPRWATMLNGDVYQRPNAEQITNETEFGLLLPTPTCHNAKEGNYPAERSRKTPLLATHVGGKIHPHFTEWMMGLPQGWTDLRPLGMHKFLLWRQQHSES
jgi:hypothetical protein